jgi:hypothetical protein
MLEVIILVVTFVATLCLRVKTDFAEEWHADFYDVL